MSPKTDEVKEQRSEPENRRANRVQVEAFVKVDLDGPRASESDEWVLRTRDLSKNGLFLYTKVAHAYPFTVGSSLRIELYDYNTFVSCRVVVARVVGQNTEEAAHYPVGFGVRIVEISKEDQKRLDAILERVDSGESLY